MHGRSESGNTVESIDDILDLYLKHGRIFLTEDAMREFFPDLHKEIQKRKYRLSSDFSFTTQDGYEISQVGITDLGTTYHAIVHYIQKVTPPAMRRSA